MLKMGDGSGCLCSLHEVVQSASNRQVHRQSMAGDVMVDFM